MLSDNKKTSSIIKDLGYERTQILDSMYEESIAILEENEYAVLNQIILSDQVLSNININYLVELAGIIQGGNNHE